MTLDPSTASQLFGLLGNERRLRVLLALRDCPGGATPTLLSAPLNIGKAQLSDLLQELLALNLVHRGRSGRYVFYTPNSELIVQLGEYLKAFEEGKECPPPH